MRIGQMRLPVTRSVRYMQMPNPNAKPTVASTVRTGCPDRMLVACSSAKIADESTITTHSDLPASRSIFTAIPRVRISSTKPDEQPGDERDDHDRRARSSP